MDSRSKSLKCYLLLVGMVFVCIPKTWASDLWDIYELAIANNPEYQIAALSHEATRLNLPLAKTAFRPSLSASAQVGRENTDVTGIKRSGDDNLYSLNLDLPIYDRTKRSAITQSEIQIEISELKLAEAKQQLMLRVANSYFNVLAAQDAREVARLGKIAIRRQMELASERLEVGLGTRTDLFDAKARFKLAEANEIQAQNQINTETALLRQIIGLTPEVLSTLSDSAPLEFPSPDDVNIWIRKSLDKNTPLNIERLNVEVALEEIDKQKHARYPTVSLIANHRKIKSGSSFGSSSGETNTSNVGVAVNFPFYLGGAINLRTRQAGYLYNQTERRLEQVRRLASTQTTTAFLAVTSRVSQVEALFDAITAGESALEAKEEGFSAGLTTNLDVLDAQRDLSRSRTDYLRARYDYIISLLELEKSAGQLDEENIQRVNKWLTD